MCNELSKYWDSDFLLLFHNEDMKYRNSDLIKAVRYSRDTKDDLLRCTICGCYNCTEIFLTSEIHEWRKEGKNLIGICPFCKKETILSEDAGYPFTKEFLKAVKKTVSAGRWKDVI